MKVYLGIDPGKKGGIAVITEEGEIEAFPLDERVLHMQIQSLAFDDCVCCLEKVHAMPGQGVTSMFTFGEGYGFIRGMLAAYNIPYQEIQPQKWKKEFGLSGEKASSIEVAHRLFPTVSLKATERCRTDHDGMAEALLMAEYARRKL